MENCIFCQIIKGEVEAKKVYEDESVLAFIPKDPVGLGHTLVIPKEHFKDIFDISSQALSEVMKVTQELSKKITREVGGTGVNILQASGQDAQQSVFHFHLHIVPRFPNDGLDLWFKVGIENK